MSGEKVEKGEREVKRVKERGKQAEDAPPFTPKLTCIAKTEPTKAPRLRAVEYSAAMVAES